MSSIIKQIYRENKKFMLVGLVVFVLLAGLVNALTQVTPTNIMLKDGDGNVTISGSYFGGSFYFLNGTQVSATGPQGPEGPTGSPGPSGAPGATGAPGVDGSNATATQTLPYQNITNVPAIGAYSFLIQANDPVSGNYSARYPNGTIFITSTNAALTINNAINATTRGTVFVKNGNYTVTQMIVPKSHVNLIGESRTGVWFLGTTSLGPNDPVIQYWGTSTALIEGTTLSSFSVDGTNMNHTGYAIGRKAVQLYFNKDCVVRDIRVFNTTATGIATDESYNCLVDSCILEYCGTVGETGGSNGVGTAEGQMMGQSCTIQNCVSNYTANNGFMYEKGGNYWNTGSFKILNCYSFNDHIGLRSSGIGNVIFEGNQVINSTTYGLALSDFAGTPTAHANNCSIIGNTFMGNNLTGTMGINLSDNTGSAIVDSNTLSGWDYGIVFNAANDNIIVTSNKISYCWNNGIRVDSGSNAIISNNIVFNTCQNPVGYTESFRLVALVNSTINGNRIYWTSGGVMNVGIREYTTSDYNIYVANSINCKTTGIITLGVNSHANLCYNGTVWLT